MKYLIDIQEVKEKKKPGCCGSLVIIAAFIFFCYVLAVIAR